MSHFENRIQVSKIVKNQLPEFITVDFPKAIEFLKQYYISQEYQGGTTDLIDNLDQYITVSSLVPDALNSSSKLSASIDASDDTLYVTNTKGYPDSYGLIKIDDEIITYTKKTENSFTGCIRGFSGVTSYDNKSIITNGGNKLVFKSTDASSHTEGTEITNLSTLFLKEFYRKIKYMIAPGLEDIDLSDDIDVSLFLSNARDFFQSKGIEESIKILFKVLYGEDAKIIDLEKYLAKPSAASYIRRKVLVAEKISGGDPQQLVGETLFSSNDPDVKGSISEVDIITRNRKEYFQISLFIGFSDDILLENDFSLPGKTQVIGNVPAGSNIITVDTTIGFPDSGTIISGNNNIQYTSKSVNQFFGCTGIDEDISDIDEIRENIEIFGYVNGDITQKVTLRLTGVVSSYNEIDKITSSEVGDSVFIKNAGIKVENPEIDKSYLEIFSNSWIYNTSSRYRVREVQNNDTFSLFTPIDKSSLKVGDSVSVYSRNDTTPAPGGENGIIASINVANNSVRINNIPLFSTTVNGEYDIKRNLQKVTSSGVQIDVGNDQYTSDLTNLYVDDALENAYIASNSLPKNILSKNIISYTLPDGSETYFEDYDVLTDTYSTLVFPENLTQFVDGDRITYKSDSPIGGLENERTYYIKKIGTNKIRLYASPIISDLYVDGFVRVKPNTEDEAIHKFILFRHSNEVLSSNSILRKFPLSQNLDKTVNTVTDQDEIGILIDGVEISSPKSNDKLYFGPLSSVDVLNGGDGFSVLNPPKLTIKDPNTTAVIEPVIEGSIKEVLVDPQEFEVSNVFSITVSGGNGTGAILDPIFTEVTTEYRFDTRLLSNNGGLDADDNTITFLEPHTLTTGDPIVYTSLGNLQPIPLGAEYKGLFSLADGGVYYARFVNTSTIRVHGSAADAIAGINELDLEPLLSAGIHAFRTPPLKNLGRVRITDSGSGYSYRKLRVKPVGVSTVENEINYTNHGFKTGDIVEYANEGTIIAGLSTTNSYSVEKIDDDRFKLYDVGIGVSNTNNVIRKDNVIFGDVGVGTHIFKYPDIKINAVIGYGSTITGDIVFTPVITGPITQIYLEESGNGYGSDAPNFHLRPQIEIPRGTGCQLNPIIVNGYIEDVQVLSTGSNYSNDPEITIISPFSGTGAILRPIVTDGRITDIIVISKGIGYDENSTSIEIKDRGFGEILEASVRSININDVPRFGQYKLTNRKKTEKLSYSVYYYDNLLANVFNDNNVNTHSPIIGWSYDGIPIYGPYGFSDPKTFGSTIKRLESSYVSSSANIVNRPSTSLYPLGSFIDDFSYVKGQGDLDEHNGRFCRTPEFPDGIYAYFAATEISQTTGNLTGKYPYFIGKTYRSKLIENSIDLNQLDFDFNSSNLSRNTFPYLIGEEFAENDYIVESYEGYTQSSRVFSTTRGGVDTIEIINPGENYRVGERINFENVTGSGFKAEISEIKGKPIVDIETTTLQYYDLSLTREGDGSVILRQIPYTGLDINDNDFITISGLSTSIDGLNNKSFRVSVETQSQPISVAVSISENIDPNGVVEYLQVTRIPEFVSVGSSCSVNGEDVRILNIYDELNTLNIKRFGVGAAISATSPVVFYPDKLKIPTKTQYFESKHNKIIYFNAKNSVGVGTTAGGIDSKVYAVGVNTEVIGVPLRSIYLPNHGLQTGDKLTIRKSPLVGVDAIIAGDTDDGLNTFALPNLVNFEDTVFAINKGLNYIGLVTQVGLTTSDGLYFFTDGTDNFEYSLETDYEQVNGDLLKIFSEVTTEEDHGLKEGDFINVKIIPNEDVGAGIGSTSAVKLYIDGERLLTDKVFFDSSAVSLLDNTITITNHGYNDGDKIYYSATPGDNISSLPDGEYFVRYNTANKINLCKTRYDLFTKKKDIVFESIGGSNQSISLIHPEIKVVKNNNLVFELSDESLQGYEFNFYYDQTFTSEFVTSKDDFEYNVVSSGSTIGYYPYTIKLNYSNNVPSILYYNVTKSGFINTSDVSVSNYNKIVYSTPDFDGEYPVVNVGTSKTFQFSPESNPPFSSLSATNTSLMEYSTSSDSVFGPIARTKILAKGFDYSIVPEFKDIDTTDGKNANVRAISNDIGVINSVEIVDAGFEYSSDKTLSPETLTPYPLDLINADSVKQVDVLFGGNNYISPPDLILINEESREIIDDISFIAEAPGSTITNVDLIGPVLGIPDSTHTLIAVNNSNGISISSITSSNSGIVTCTLVTPFTGYASSIFSAGDQIFVENIQRIDESVGTGYNSTDYGFKFFEVVDYTNSNPAILKYKIPEELSVNPGLAKTFQFGYAQIVSKNNYPIFDVIQEREKFSPGEKLFVSRNGGEFLEQDIKVQSSRKDFLKVFGRFKLLKDDIVRGQFSGNQATILKGVQNRSKYNVDYFTVKNLGWSNDIGKTSELFQRIPDNDYYQNLSYSIKTKIPFEECIVPVNRIVHPAGLKNFVDVGITSSVTIGISTDLPLIETTVVLDVKSEKYVDTYNNFDLVLEVDVLDPGTDNEKSKYIQALTTRFTDFIVCKTNRPIAVDNISQLFTNKEFSTDFVEIDKMTDDYARYLIQVKNPDTFEIQLSEVLATNSTLNIFTNRRFNLLSDTTSGTSKGKELGDFYAIKNGDNSIVFEPNEKFDSDYDLKILDSFHTLQQIGIGTLTDKFNVGKTILSSSVVGVTSLTENSICSFASTTFGSVHATIFIENNASQEHRVVDYNVINIDGQIYDGLFYMDNENTAVSDNSIGIVTTKMVDGDNVEIRVINQDETSNYTVKSQIVTIPQALDSNLGISTYLFSFAGTNEAFASNAKYESFDISSTGITSIKSQEAFRVTSAYGRIQVSAGSTISFHKVGFVHDNACVYTTQGPILATGDSTQSFGENANGIGTFGGSIQDGFFNMNFYPDSEYIGIGLTIQGFFEMFYSEFDTRNIPEETEYGSNSTQFKVVPYDGRNGERAEKKDFPLQYKGTDIYQKVFNPSNEVTLGIDSTTNEAIWNIKDHFFNTGEELEYSIGNTFAGVNPSPIGIGLTLNNVGILTDKLPEVVYPIVLTPDKFKLAVSQSDVGLGIGVTITDYGQGNQHKLDMTKKLTKSVLSLNGIVQQPISYTTITHEVAYNQYDNNNPVSIAATFFSLSGISSVQPRDILQINDEYMKVVEIGLSTSSVGPVGLSLPGIAATIPCVGVERGVIGSASTTFSDGDEVRVYRGSYDIVDSRVYFLEAPSGNAREERDESNLPFPTSSFDGRIFTRANYDSNIIFDDISDSFTGIGKTYTIKSNGIDTTGLSNGNGVLFINGVFQTPTTLNNIRGNYELIVNQSIGISSVQFSGITSTDGSFVTSEFDINQNQIPRGGIIVSYGTTTGLGYAPLNSAVVGLVTDASGSIVEVVTKNSRNRSFDILTASYDNTTGILDITTDTPNVFNENDPIQLEGLEFSCDSEHAGITTTIFPDGSSPQGFTFPIITKYSDTRFTVEVGISTISHTYVGFGTAYEYLTGLNYGSGYRGGSVSVAVTEASHTGTEAIISATVGLGGTISFNIDNPGSGYYEPVLTIPEASYDNIEIVGTSRLGIGSTTDTGSNTLVSLTVGPQSNPIFADRYADAANLIEDNKVLIAEVAVGRMLDAFPVFTIPGGNQNCIDDIVDTLESVAYNLRYGGNDLTYDAANLYITGAHVAGEEEESVYAFEEARTMAIQAMRNEAITIGGYSNEKQVFDYSITGDQSGEFNNYNPGDCADVASTIDTLVGIVTTAIDSSTLPALRNIAQGSLNEITGFKFARPGHSFNVGDKFTAVGLVTDARLSEPIEPFEVEVVEIFNDFFSGWQFGELDFIDSFSRFQDGSRTRFPLYYNGELVSFEKDSSNELSEKIDLNAVLLIFINGVIQTPGVSYTYEGGTSLNFSRPPDSDDKVDVFFYVGDRNVDVDISDIRETIKVGDTVLIRKEPNDLSTRSQTRERTVTDIPQSDTLETDIYVGVGINDEVYKPMDWTKQKSDLIINGEVISKARRVYEPRIYPTAKVIGDLTTANDTNIFVDNARQFFIEEDLYSEVIEQISTLIIDTTPTSGAAATATVDANSGEITAITITDGGSGYVGNETISLSAPKFRKDGTVGIGTSPAELQLTFDQGTVSGATISFAGLGYTFTEPPQVIIETPDIKKEQINGIQLYQGFSGIITGITTSAGTNGHPLALNFFFRSDTSDANDLAIGYPVLITDTVFGEGVTSVFESDDGVVGIGTSFFDNVYIVADKFNVGPIADITCNVLTSDAASLESIIGNGITGDTTIGKLSWGRLYNYIDRTNPVSIGVTGLTIDSGLSTFPTIQRRNFGFFNNGSISIA